MVTCRLILASQPEFEQALQLRHKVFVEEQGVPPELERDEHDSSAHHAMAFQEDRLLGTARLVRDGARGKIGRVAVSRQTRGQGTGVELMRFLEQQAGQMGLSELYLDAQLAVIGFYERLGYTAEGEIFLDAGIQHRRMRKQL